MTDVFMVMVVVMVMLMLSVSMLVLNTVGDGVKDAYGFKNGCFFGKFPNGLDPLRFFPENS